MEMADSPNKNEAMPKRGTRFLFCLLALVSIVASAFFQETIAFFDDVYTTWMSDLEYWISFAAVCFLLASTFLVGRRLFHAKPKPWLIALLSAVFLGSCIAILSFPEATVLSPRGTGSSETTYLLDSMSRARFLASLAVGLTTIYLIVAVCPRLGNSIFTHHFFFIFAITLALVAIIWSLIFELPLYQSVLSFEGGAPRSATAKSFTMNRNLFGFLLFLGQVSCSFLLARKIKAIWASLFLLFYAELFFIGSKTPLILSSVLFFAVYLPSLVNAIRRRNLSAVLGVCIPFALSVVAISVVFATNQTVRNWAAVSLSAVFRPYEGSTIEQRVSIWTAVLGYMKERPMLILFGFGEGNFNWFLGQFLGGGAPHIGYTDNGYVFQFGAGGVLRLCCYAVFFGWLFVRAVLALRSKTRGRYSCFVSFLLFAIYSLTESVSFLQGDTKDLAILLVVAMPILSMGQTETAPEIPARRAVQTDAAKNSLAVLALLSLILVPLCAIGHGLSLIGEDRGMGSPSFLLNAFAVLLFIPLAFFLSAHRVKKPFAILCMVSASIAAGVSLILSAATSSAVVPLVFGTLSLLMVVVLSILVRKSISQTAFLQFFLMALFGIGLSCVLILIGRCITHGFSARLVTRYVCISLAFLTEAILLLFYFATPFRKAFGEQIVLRMDQGVSFVSARLYERRARSLSKNAGHYQKRLSRKGK